MGHVRGEPPLPFAGLGQRRDLGLQGRGHLVERGRPGPELVVGLHRQPGVEQSLSHRSRGPAGPGHRAEGPPGQQQPGQRRQQHGEDPPGSQDDGQLLEVVPEPGFVEHEVQLDVPVGHRSPHHQRGVAEHRLPFVGDLTVLNECLEIGWRPERQQARGRRHCLAIHERHRRDPPGGEEVEQPVLDVLGRRIGREVLAGELHVLLGQVDGPVYRVVQAGLPDQQERPHGEGARGEPGHQDERDEDPPAEAGGGGDAARHPATPRRAPRQGVRAGSRRPGWSGSSWGWPDPVRPWPGGAARPRPPAGSRPGSRSSTPAPAGSPG